MDAEKLKDNYNNSYKKAKDNWSDTNSNYTDAIIRKIVKYITNHGFRLNEGNKSLDVGCAKGYFTESFRKMGFDSFGFDYSDVAINIAKSNFSSCNFFIMDGFNPSLESNYDVIFMKGFSGTNTHDLKFVSEMSNKYIENLNKNGWFIISYPTDFSGKEKPNEMVNWSLKEIDELALKIKGAKLVSIQHFNYGFIWRQLRKVMNLVGFKRKYYFYLMFHKQN